MEYKNLNTKHRTIHQGTLLKLNTGLSSLGIGTFTRSETYKSFESIDNISSFLF